MPTLAVGMRARAGSSRFLHAHGKRGHGTELSALESYSTDEGCMMNAVFKWNVFLLFGLFFINASITAANGGGKCGDIWIDVYQGEPLPYAEVLADLANADVIYLGERHTIARHHAIQERILTDLGKKSIPLAVGLEQMETFRQPQLDRYNRGEIDFDELAKATDWANRWGNFAQYRGILEAARKLKAPVVALNAKAETIRQVARSGGVEKMPAEARKELPAEMQLQDPAYEKALSLELQVHASAMAKAIRPMIEAQMARDESMARAIGAFLESKEGKGRKMIVICGGGHVARGLGTPARVRRRMPGVKDRIVLLSESGEVQLSPAELAMASNVQITHEQMRELSQPIADYLCVKPLSEENAEPPKSNPKIPDEIERAMLGEGNMGIWDPRRMEMLETPPQVDFPHENGAPFVPIPNTPPSPQQSPLMPEHGDGWCPPNASLHFFGNGAILVAILIAFPWPHLPDFPHS